MKNGNVTLQLDQFRTLVKLIDFRIDKLRERGKIAELEDLHETVELTKLKSQLDEVIYKILTRGTQ